MSIAAALVCDCCRRTFTPHAERVEASRDANWNSGPERYTAHELRDTAKDADWKVQVAGIAHPLRRKQGWRDFCPTCIENFDAEESRR